MKEMEAHPQWVREGALSGNPGRLTLLGGFLIRDRSKGQHHEGIRVGQTLRGAIQMIPDRGNLIFRRQGG